MGYFNDEFVFRKKPRSDSAEANTTSQEGEVVDIQRQSLVDILERKIKLGPVTVSVVAIIARKVPSDPVRVHTTWSTENHQMGVDMTLDELLSLQRS